MARQLLLMAEPLLREGLCLVLDDAGSDWRVVTESQDLRGSPQLLIWCVDTGVTALSLAREVALMRERWRPSPLLIVLPQGLSLDADTLLNLPTEGLLEAPDPQALIDAIDTLLQGGRCLRLAERPASTRPPQPTPTLGLGQWLLISGLQQIDRDLAGCAALLQSEPDNLMLVLVLQGRQRELKAARQLLLQLWGPLSLAWGDLGPPPQPAAPAPHDGSASTGLALSLRQRNADGSWQAIADRLRDRISAGLSNRSGQLLALEGLHPDRRSDLMLALLDQLQQLRQQLASSDRQPRELREHWLTTQRELRQAALRRMASPYVRMPLNGELQPVAEWLLRLCELDAVDPELPDAQNLLQTLVLGQPLLVDGHLLAPDAPLAVLHLEHLIANWLVRTAELISAQVLGCSSAWPELRRYMLVSELLATRNLERLRNQLNAQQRWSTWLERPMAIYESRRSLFTIGDEGIGTRVLTEPRDQDLAQLSAIQQLVTLALESRDALAPQLQGLIRALGQLVVIVLTKVIGRAIGLVGRGIVQGMGRGLQQG